MKDWKEEMQKCIESPYYFYINYCKVEGVPVTIQYTEEQFNELIKQGLTVKQIIDE